MNCARIGPDRRSLFPWQRDLPLSGGDNGRTNRETRMMEAEIADLISHVITGMKRLSGPLARR
ncbi:hypothetical protein NY486_18730, partial [Enterobacter hormaechei]|nr:hypothetical protein [Enterobacter hormaechei]